MYKSIALLIISLAISPAFTETMKGAASATFDVKATVDSFIGHANSEPFEIQEGDERIHIIFTIANMETGKKKRDKEMLHMFHADEFPVLSGSADAKTIRALVPSDNTVELPVEFIMHGVTREVVGAITQVEKTDAGLAFNIAFPLVLSEFGLKAPSVMKIIRVKDVVKVSALVTISNE